MFHTKIKNVVNAMCLSNPHFSAKLAKGFRFPNFSSSVSYDKMPLVTRVECIPKHREEDKRLHRAVSVQKKRLFLSFTQWRTAILTSFGYDPLKCPNCGHNMEFLELYLNHLRVSLEEMYENAVSKFHKFRGKRSSAWFSGFYGIILWKEDDSLWNQISRRCKKIHW